MPHSIVTSSTLALPSVDVITDATLTYRVAGQIRTVLSRFTLHMQLGTCLAIIGPNACGKSSLLRAVLRLVSIDEGRVGIQLSQRDYLGCVLQDYRAQLIPWENVGANLSLPLRGLQDPGIDEGELHANVTALLHNLGYNIPLSKKVMHLSGGQQQAVVLARALACRPMFSCWDEPTSAIDFPKRGILYDILQRRWNQENSSVLLVTHDTDEALLLADRIVVVDTQMHVLFDQEVLGPKRQRDRRYLETEEARTLQYSIREAMIGSDVPPHSNSLSVGGA